MRGPCLPENLQTERLESAAVPPLAAHFSVQIRHRVGALKVHVDFQLTRAWTILFGPSGAGKTTILRTIAGLLRPDSARIVSIAEPGAVDESSLVLIDTAGGICVPVHRRRVVLASQRSILFPHLSVLENLNYGASSSRSLQAAHLAKLFHVEDVLSKRPAQLSGGEVQRVCLARAAMTGRQRILLLDEPFTGLDRPLRDSLIANLLAWQAESGTPILSVTHDIAEAFQLGAEVIKLADGCVIDQGPVETALGDEREQLLRQLNRAKQSPA